MHERTVLVTGAASGIGRAVAIQAAARGANCVLADRDAAGAVAVATKIEAAGGKAVAMECDTSSETSVAAMFEALAWSGVIADGVVTAAGVDVGGPAHRLSPRAWRGVLEVNLTGSFLICRAAIAALLGAGRPGSLVLCSSPAAYAGFSAGGAAAYSASKGGVSALVRSLAVDYARHGIRVNAIVPGPTETDLMWAAVPEADRERMRGVIRDEVPLGRLANPDEPARAAIWLLGDEASYVTGSHLVCDGGVLAKASVSV